VVQEPQLVGEKGFTGHFEEQFGCLLGERSQARGHATSENGNRKIGRHREKWESEKPEKRETRKTGGKETGKAGTAKAEKRESGKRGDRETGRAGNRSRLSGAWPCG
jgi:hypothetical protein